MKPRKDETVSIRTSAEIKQLLRMAAAKEHRSIASMVEVLILAHAQQHGFAVAMPHEVQNITRDTKKHGTD